MFIDKEENNFNKKNTDLGIPKAGNLEEKGELNMMLKWGNLFLMFLRFLKSC